MEPKYKLVLSRLGSCYVHDIEEISLYSDYMSDGDCEQEVIKAGERYLQLYFSIKFPNTSTFRYVGKINEIYFVNENRYSFDIIGLGKDYHIDIYKNPYYESEN